MKRELLIVNHTLNIGGGEKLVYELAKFAREQDLDVCVLILNDYQEQFYDQPLRDLGVTVVRTRLTSISALRRPSYVLRAIRWRTRLRHFATRFSAVHVVNLTNAAEVRTIIRHPRRYFWHIGHAIQYPGGMSFFSPELFDNEKDTIVLVDPNQANELKSQFPQHRCSLEQFKLFVTP